MDQLRLFNEECQQYILRQVGDKTLDRISKEFLKLSFRYKYPYNFEFLGRPIIQYPQDIVAIQDLIWQTKPSLIIETGIAHGGSLIMSAAMLALLDICEALELGTSFNPSVSKRKVLGVDIDIRPHNRAAIEMHPLSSRIEMIQGSSIAPEIVEKVREVATCYDRILVCLDSDHRRDHVLAELNAYAPLVNVGSYCVVFDTIVEDLPADSLFNRPWGRGDSPKAAVQDFLKTHPEFKIDTNIQNKLLITVAADGYLKRIA